MTDGRTALIGSTGFVGGSLLARTSFDDLFHATDIEDIRGRSYRLLICAGAPAVKWKANEDPAADLANLQRLMGCLATVTARRFLLISTVDVYPVPTGTDESSPVDAERNHAYGRHRYRLETFVRERFAGAQVIRLPGLFGPGLRKNFIHDLLHDEHFDLTHRDSAFQLYDMRDFWRDAQTVLDSGVPLVNFATEPLRAAEIARDAFGIEFGTVTARPPVRYDMHTRYAALFGGTGRYMRSAAAVMTALRDFVAWHRAEGGP